MPDSTKLFLALAIFGALSVVGALIVTHLPFGKKKH